MTISNDWFDWLSDWSIDWYRQQDEFTNIWPTAAGGASHRPGRCRGLCDRWKVHRGTAAGGAGFLQLARLEGSLSPFHSPITNHRRPIKIAHNRTAGGQSRTGTKARQAESGLGRSPVVRSDMGTTADTTVIRINAQYRRHQLGFQISWSHRFISSFVNLFVIDVHRDDAYMMLGSSFTVNRNLHSFLCQPSVIWKTLKITILVFASVENIEQLVHSLVKQIWFRFDNPSYMVEFISLHFSSLYSLLWSLNIVLNIVQLAHQKCPSSPFQTIFSVKYPLVCHWLICLTLRLPANNGIRFVTAIELGNHDCHVHWRSPMWSKTLKLICQPKNQSKQTLNHSNHHPLNSLLQHLHVPVCLRVKQETFPTFVFATSVALQAQLNFNSCSYWDFIDHRDNCSAKLSSSLMMANGIFKEFVLWNQKMSPPSWMLNRMFHHLNLSLKRALFLIQTISQSTMYLLGLQSCNIFVDFVARALMWHLVIALWLQDLHSCPSHLLVF